MTAEPPGRSRRLPMIAGFALALLMLVVAALINWSQDRRAEETAALMVRTYEAQRGLNRLLSLVQDVETGARGFVLTGDPAFLEPFEAALNAVGDQERSPRQLIVSDEQQANLAAFESAVARRIAISRSIVELRQNAGFEAAQQAVAGGEGEAAMDAVRAQYARMNVAEQRLLEERAAVARREKNDAVLVGEIIIGLSAALLIALFALLLRENRLRHRAHVHATQLNVDLQARSAQLAEANKDLESFSYSVSHDLRAPLRHVHGYVEMLQQATGGQLSEQAQRYLNTISKASLDMGQLIDDLLGLSRVGHAEMRESDVRLDQLVQNTIRGLEMATRGRNIVWQTAPLPPVVGDPPLLKQLLANLIDNAVKYSRWRDPAEIAIGCAGEEDGRVILFVRDNGAGFDMQYAHKLFGVFQRLHRADEFEGTGIGLATVRQIVTRHGGRVWAEGAVDQGATFYFTLQRSPSA